MHFQTSRLSKLGQAYLKQEAAVLEDMVERGCQVRVGQEEWDFLCGKWLEIGKRHLLSGESLEQVEGRLIGMADQGHFRGMAGACGPGYHAGEHEMNLEMIRQVMEHFSAVSLKVVSREADDEAAEAARAAAAKESERRFMLKRLLGG